MWHVTVVGTGFQCSCLHVSSERSGSPVRPGLGGRHGYQNTVQLHVGAVTLQGLFPLSSAETTWSRVSNY